MHTEATAAKLATGAAARIARACAAEGHEYAERTCPKCAGEFCYTCAAGACETPYMPHTLTCPFCGEVVPL